MLCGGFSAVYGQNATANVAWLEIGTARLSRIPSLWVEGSHEIECTAFVVFPKLFLEIASGFLFSSPARAG
jgi:hypothetical protein